jgi:signal transduction histidine kinase
MVIFQGKANAVWLNVVKLWLPILFAATLSACAESLVLTQAVQVLNLSIEEAKSNLSVRLQGVVISGRDLPAGQAVINDGSASIYIFGDSLLARRLARTNLVEIEGVTQPGEFARCVTASKVRVLGKGQIPPPKRVTYADMLMGQLDGQWVEVEGCLRSCVYLKQAMPSRRDGMLAELATGGERLAMEVYDHQINPDWVDGMVQVRGICFHKFNQKRQFYQMYLCVPEGESAVLLKPPPSLDNLPTNQVANLLQFPNLGSVGHRVRVTGVVTYWHPGEFLYLYDGEHGLLVRASAESRLYIGDAVSVVGFPAQGDYSPILEDAVWTVLNHGNRQPDPTPIQHLADAFEHDAELISGRAKLLGILRQDNGWTISLQMGNAVFTASLLQTVEATGPPKFEIGSELDFSGVCSVVMGPLMPRKALHTPQSIRLLLRTPDDLKLIKSPPWWTPQRVLIAATIIVSLLTACLALIILFARTRLQRQQEGRRSAEIEFAAVFNERNRIARELHDTLAQGLGAITLHLDLVKEQHERSPEKAARHLDIAYQTAQQSLTEARESISNMRSHILENVSLAEALQQVLRQLTEDTQTQGQFTVAGTPRRLAPVIENNLLRVGQEAISNAIKHAKAKTISVALEYAPERANLTVCDDGAGFDPGHLPPGQHFGLTGQRERTMHLGGTLEVKSSPGHGTEVKLSIPI